ncbi:carbohydrate ABC transporter permease [Paenibacillus sp. YYML68]|uniref:carbohydrate ABC transporter permease n=1 Tax=Paenibacillus sp. YYML68 TaxID=2909250 RepID=UPI0024926007|nr:sugar ABC transporter permease [Paenibacillus sp. YYML68]
MSAVTTAAPEGLALEGKTFLLRRIRRHAWHYVFIMPMLILFVLFTLWPMAGSIYYAFFNWDGVGPATDYVGLDNFRETVSNPYFWNAFTNNYVFALAHLAIQYPLALLLAIVLNNAMLRGRNAYRLLIFLPVVTTTALIGLVFNVLLHPAGGPINAALLGSGLLTEPINFLGSEKLALPTAIGISIWKNIGITMIYWLAALQTIPQDLYEAARIDGASRQRTFFSITVPLVAPIGAVILLLTFMQSLHPFDLIQALTQGGPNYASDVVDTFVYRYAFNPEMSLPRYGFASAAGLVFGLTIMLITLVQGVVVRTLRRK